MADESGGVTLGDDGSPRFPDLYSIEELSLAFDRGISEYLDKGESEHLRAAMENSIQALSWLPEGNPERVARWLRRITFVFANSDMHSLNLEALETAITVFGLDLFPSEDPAENALSRINHFKLLLLRYENTGITDGLDEGFDAARQAAAFLPSNNHIQKYFRDVEGQRFFVRFKRTGNIEDLSSAIIVIREALSSFELGMLEKRAWRSRLASSLTDRFEMTPNFSDIEEAFSNVQQAITTYSDDSKPDLQLYLQLGYTYQIKYAYTGNIEDLDKSIQANEKVIELLSGRELRTIAMVLEALGSCLLQRYYVTKNQEDLKRAISNLEHALSLGRKDDGQPEHRLNSLGLMKMQLFQRTGQANDLEQAIEVFSSLESKLPPGHLQRPIVLSNLAVALKATDTIEGINTAIEKAQEAVEATPEKHANRSALLNILGSCFIHQYDMTQIEGHLDKAIQIYKQAISSATDHSRAKKDRSVSLGICLVRKYEASSDTKYRDEAIQYFVDLVKTPCASHWLRVVVARVALVFLIGERDWTQAEEILNIALELLPRACSRHMSREDQQHNLRLASGLAADACSLSLRCGKVEEAIQRAEMGRGVILSHLMDNRADLSLLRQLDRGLAKEYEDVRNMAFQSAESEDFVVREALFRKRQKARERMKQLETEIRKKPKLRFFLQSPSVKAIQQCAFEGPIVIVNVTDIGSDAIIITDDAINTVNLSAMTSQPPNFFAQELRNYRSEGRNDSGHRNFVHQHLQDNDSMQWLWYTCVKPVLDNLPSSNDLTRTWWIGSGVASSLPFHTAGDYSSESKFENCLARTIPSYAPTIKALINARSNASSHRKVDVSKFQALTISMPSTPGAEDLKGVKKEQDAIREAVKDVISFRSLGRPTASTVLTEIKHSNIAHFACHGFSHPIDPSNSHLLLQKRDDTGRMVDEVDRLTVSSLLETHGGKNRWIAYLSTCSTAQVSEREFADEGLHLASAFQAAGYSHVIGSLWPTRDGVCVSMARLFYTNLVKNRGASDLNRAVASALRDATIQLRSANVYDFGGWAPYIHWRV